MSCRILTVYMYLVVDFVGPEFQAVGRNTNLYVELVMLDAEEEFRFEFSVV